jgi:hypothetical protein
VILRCLFLIPGRAARPARKGTQSASRRPGPAGRAPARHGRPARPSARGQIFYLLLGEVEPDSCVYPGYCADRDGDLLAPPDMSLLEQHVGYMVIARIYEEASYLPDLAIKGMDGLTPTYLCFT